MGNNYFRLGIYHLYSRESYTISHITKILMNLLHYALYIANLNCCRNSTNLFLSSDSVNLQSDDNHQVRNKQCWATSHSDC